MVIQSEIAYNYGFACLDLLSAGIIGIWLKFIIRGWNKNSPRLCFLCYHLSILLLNQIVTFNVKINVQSQVPVRLQL